MNTLRAIELSKQYKSRHISSMAGQIGAHAQIWHIRMCKDAEDRLTSGL